MAVKFSQLPVTTNLATPANIFFPVVDNTGPTSYTTTLTSISSQILAGNAASATKLATARTINGVSFDGTANITVATAISPATISVLGGVIPDNVTIGIDGSGKISTITVQATTTTYGSVMVGNGLSVSSGVISAPTTVVHAFAFDANNNLIYTQTSGQSFAYTTDGANSSYSLVDIGTNAYGYSLDTNGNLIATFNS
jgi:hypothetical protein